MAPDAAKQAGAKTRSAQTKPKEPSKLSSVTASCRPRLPPGMLSARRIERSIAYAEMGYYIFFLLTVPMLLWRYGDILRYDMGLGSGDPICDEMTKWILDGGGMIDGSRCVYTPEGGGRGIVATTRLSHRQTYSVVPLDLCMWEKTVKERSEIAEPVLISDPVVQRFCGHPWGPNSTADPWRLILAVDYERQIGERSFWSVYFKTMPGQPTSPIWWTDEQLAELQTPVLAEEVKKLKRQLKDAYDALFPHLTNAHPELYGKINVTLESFTWAALQVWGRAFDASAQDPNDANRRTWMMVPFIDLVNHQSYVGSFYGDEEATVGDDEKAFSCWATECFTSGAEIFQSYGSHKSAAHYFLYYGFIPLGFEQGDVISYVVPRDVELQFAPSSWKMGYAGADGRVTEGFLHQLVRAVVIKRKAMAANATGEVIKGAVAASTAEIMADAAAWRAVLEHVLERTRRALLEQPTTLEEEEAALDSLAFEYNAWVKLTVRLRFKRVLKTIVANLEHRLAADVNSESSWEVPEQHWSIVHQRDTVNMRRSKALKHESLFEVGLEPDIHAMAEASFASKRAAN